MEPQISSSGNASSSLMDASLASEGCQEKPPAANYRTHDSRRAGPRDGRLMELRTANIGMDEGDVDVHMKRTRSGRCQVWRAHTVPLNRTERKPFGNESGSW